MINTHAFSAVGVGPASHVGAGDTFSYSISGSASATLQIERTTNGGTTWSTVLTSTSNAVSTHIKNIDRDALYRWRCTSYTSGTATASIKTGAEQFRYDLSLQPGATDNEKLLSAITQAQKTGGSVYVPPGTWGPMSIDVVLTNDLTIMGEPGSSVLTYGPTASCLVLRSPYQTATEYTVSALSTVTTGSASGMDDSVTRLTLASGASAFAEGDICKIYSQDASHYGDASSKNFMGELFEVRSVDTGNNYIFVKGLLSLSYTTSVRVRKIDKKKVTIRDIEIEIDASANIYDDTLTDRAGAMRLWAIHEPELKGVTIRSAWAQAVNLIACWMPDIDVRTDRVINGTDPTWGPGVDALGYGVSTMTCFGGRITMMAESCRHAFTTLHPEDTVFSSSRWIEYGETIGTVISGIAVNCEGAAFDTHESGLNLTFENCLSLFPRRSDYGSIRGKGFNNRARGTRHINCRTVGGTVSFTNSDVDHGAKHTVTYINCDSTDAINTSQAAFQFDGTTNPPRVEMINCTTTGGHRIVDVNGGHVIITGGAYVIAGDWFARVKTGATLNIHGVTVDFTNSTNTEAFCRMTGTSSATITASHVIEGSSRCTGWFHDEDGSGTKTCRYGALTSTTGSLALSASGSSTVLTPTNITIA